MNYKFKLTGEVEIENAEPVYNADDKVVGFKLADGRVVKLTLALDIEEDGENETVIPANGDWPEEVSVVDYDEAHFVPGHMKYQDVQTIEQTLLDAGGELPPLKARVVISAGGIAIGFDGYGDKTSMPGHGEPVFVEVNGGVPRVIVWGDITEEDPTDIIGLEDAKEEARTDEITTQG